MLKQTFPQQTDANSVSIVDDDIQNLESSWGYSLIGYVAGRFPGKKALRDCCEKWGVRFSYAPHESGWLVFKFDAELDMSKVLSSGPYFIYNRPLLFKVIPKLFDFGNEELFKVPVWIKLRNLPLELWNSKALSKIVSIVGVSIRTDQQTATKGAISYARVLVEIDVSKTCLHEINIKLPGGKSLKQSLEYENIPDFCSLCNLVGHKTTKCRVHSAVPPPLAPAPQTVPPSDQTCEKEHVSSPSARQISSPPNRDNINIAGTLCASLFPSILLEPQDNDVAGKGSLELNHCLESHSIEGIDRESLVKGFSPVKTRQKRRAMAKMGHNNKGPDKGVQLEVARPVFEEDLIFDRDIVPRQNL